MNARIFCFLFFVFFTTPVLSQDNQSKLVWNKWDTQNFIILSIDKSQGLNIKKNIEDAKLNFNERWGIENKDFNIKCKFLCVTDEKMLNRLFNIEEPKAEIRKNENGEIELSAIWTDFEEDIKYLIAYICLENYNNKLFIIRGLPKLEKNVNSIRKDFSNYFEEIDVEKIFSMDKKEWSNLSTEEKEKFDIQSSLICMLLRKELGKNKFSLFLQSAQDEASLKSIYGFSDLSHFSKTLNRYCKNLSKDISNNITPDSYFKIGE